MSAPKLLFKPRFTPISPDIDIPRLVHTTPNLHWCHREDSRLHAAPFHKLSQIIYTVTIEQGLPIVVDNWHLRNDWNGALFSKEWLDREHGSDEIVVRDLVKAQDIMMSTSYYLSQVPILAGQDFAMVKNDPKEKGPRRQYGKDIDCPQEWRDALAQLLPREVSYLGGNDLMTKLPPEARAENMMIYIGHEGTYTPAHKDMCATYAQNIMVSTSPSPNGVEGMAYWFVFSARDRKRLADYWDTLGHDIDTENFFASIEDLKGFPGNVYIIEQRIGDFVIIPPLGAHQVYNHGGMTIKAAWNRTTIDTLELSLSETLPAYRHVCRDEQYKNKAIVHQSLLELSRFPPQTLLSSPHKHGSFMRLFRLYTNLLIDEFLPAEFYSHTRLERIPQQFNVACSFCRTNIWNRFLTCRGCVQLDADGDIDSYDICMECFARGRSCRDVTGLEWVQQEKWSDLMSLWERCRGIYQFLRGEDIDDFHTETSLSLGRKTLAWVCAEELIRRPSPHNLPRSDEKEGLCHTCKIRHPTWKMMYCTSEGCNRAYCFGNLFRQFDEDPFVVLSRLEGYKCPVCRGICNCGACRKRKDQIGYEPRLKSASLNPKLVADKRSVESLVDTNRTNTRWHLETKGTLTKTPSTEPEVETQRETPPLMSVIPESFSENLDPALLDPEIFFGSQSHDPPPYSKVDLRHNDTYSPHPLVDDYQESSWISNYETDFETYIALPLSSQESLDPVIDPAILSTNIQSPPRLPPLPNLVLEERSIGIAPSMLDKSVNSPSIQEETVWYSNGTAQVGGKKPPQTKHGGEGKGKGQVLGKRRAPDTERVELPESPPKSSPKSLPKSPTKSVPESPQESPPESPPLRVLGTRYEMNVETGLNTIKRIKLIFHDDAPQSSRHTSSWKGKSAADAIVVDSSHRSSRQTSPRLHSPGKKRDVFLRQRDEPRVTTTPAAIDVDVGPLLLPTANNLDLDENTPAPSPSHYLQPTRWIAIEVSIPFKHLDKSQYPVFLAKDAKQMMVKSKLSGQIKGISFIW